MTHDSLPIKGENKDLGCFSNLESADVKKIQRHSIEKIDLFIPNTKIFSREKGKKSLKNFFYSFLHKLPDSNMSTTNTQEDVYIEYLNYDWDSFQEFQDGLQEIMDNYLQNLKEQDPSVTSIPNLDKQQLINQAKSFFFVTKLVIL